MAHELSKDDMRRFARLGAMRRLEDIRKEEAAIRATFPELFSGARPAARGTKAAHAAAAPEKATAPKKAKKRSTMSPAMRKAVSERMKKYWAGRRKAKNG
ncbi:MAG: hypothetical protein JNL48_01835 [Acidobacteria bacterium]|nr:hypothetical protein [Acidobacteriota bacterium]